MIFLLHVPIYAKWSLKFKVKVSETKLRIIAQYLYIGFMDFKRDYVRFIHRQHMESRRG